MRILLVDDDPMLVQILTQQLLNHRYTVDAVSDGDAAWQYVTHYDYDLIVLDVVLPKVDGIQLCHRLRSQGETAPILLLTSQNNSTAKVMGLDSGADDYVVKPFDVAELMARIRALLRRGSTTGSTLLSWGNLGLDPSRCEVQYGDQLLNLSAKEYSLLELFLRESHHVFSIEEILDSLWSSAEFPVEATVRSHIRRLRQRLTDAGAPVDFILTAHGRGYSLNPLWRDQDSTDFVTPSTITPSPAPAESPQQAAYSQFLSQTWQTERPKVLEQLQTLEQAVATLAIDGDRQTASIPENPCDQETALRIAHTLAGKLGMFGFNEAMRWAREIEQGLQQRNVSSLTQNGALECAVFFLRQELELATNVPTGRIATPSAPSSAPLSTSLSAPLSAPLSKQQSIHQQSIHQQSIHQQSIHQQSIHQQSIHQQIKVMIVDDDLVWLQALPSLLKPWGFQVSTLDRPQQIWTFLEAIQPDFLVLDINMTEFNGLELCQALRSRTEWQQLPVLFLSACDDPKVQREALTLGADDYLCKPVQGSELAHRVIHRLERIRAYRISA